MNHRSLHQFHFSDHWNSHSTLRKINCILIANNEKTISKFKNSSTCTMLEDRGFFQNGINCRDPLPTFSHCFGSPIAVTEFNTVPVCDCGGGGGTKVVGFFFLRFGFTAVGFAKRQLNTPGMPPLLNLTFLIPILMLTFFSSL